MNRERLPKAIDPLRLAKAKREIISEVALSSLPRLSNLLAADSGMAIVIMRFDIDTEGLIAINLSIEANLTLLCQRSLDSFELPTTVNVTLSPISHERQASKLAAHYEAIEMLDGDFIDPIVMIEDELLLQLPDVPKTPGSESVSFATDTLIESEVKDKVVKTFASIKR